VNLPAVFSMNEMVVARKKRSHWMAFCVAALYALAGVIWILLSDKALIAWTNDPLTVARLQMLKGWMFVLCTSGALYFVVRYYLQALQKESDLTHLYLNVADVMMLALNRTGDVTFLNNKGCRILGCREEDAIHRNWFDHFLSPQERVEMKALYERQMRGDIPPIQYFEHQITTQTGEMKLLAMHNTVMTDEFGAPVGILSSGQDITDTRKLEEANRRMAAIVESSEDAIIGMTLEGVIVSWNKGAQCIYGYTPDEAVGQPFSLLMPLDREQEIPPILKAIQKGEATANFETIQKHKDARPLDVSLNFSPIKNTSGRLTGISVIARDITESKRLEKEILEVTEREQQRIGRDLHDGLGQNLTAVTYISQLLQKKLASKGMPDVKDAVEISKLVSDSIEQVRSLSRGLFPVELSTNGFVPALQEMANSMESKYGIPCRVEHDNCQPEIDPVIGIELYRIAQEAVNNAMKHARPSRVAIGLKMNDERLSLSVKDDGMGISTSLRDGKGMGMHIMSYRAGMIGAVLEIKDNKPKGTVVTCSAPISAIKDLTGQTI